MNFEANKMMTYPKTSKKTWSLWSQVMALVITFVTLLGLQLFCEAQTSKTVYVAPGGVDAAGNGDIGHPFKTITYAAYGAGKLGPGSTIYLRGGTYLPTNTQYLLASEVNGVANNPITIRCYPNEWPILDFSNSSGNHGLVITGSYLRVMYLQVQNAPQFGVELSGSYNEIVGCRVQGSGRSGLRCYNTGHIVRQCTICNNVRDNIPAGTVTFPGGRPAALEGYAVSNVRFEDNDVYENYGEGILFQLSSGSTIFNNRVRDSFSVNIYVDSCTYITIDSNTCTSTGKTAFYRTFNNTPMPAVGIQVANEKTSILNKDHIIKKNTVSKARYCFYKWSGGLGGGSMKNTKIYSNTFQEGISGLVLIEAGDDTSSELAGNKRNIVPGYNDSVTTLSNIWVHDNNWQ